VATNNQGKLREFEALLAFPGLIITSPGAEQVHLRVEETGRTYAENARLKATAYARASGLLTVADDSGLEVDALGGRPGLQSARFGGPHASDHNRILILLRLLAGVPLPERTARFRAVLVLAHPQGPIIQAEGTCEGIIAFAPRGRRGFGYDPVFYLPAFDRTMAQLPQSIKNRISHRALAARKLRRMAGALLRTN
jgi:XTP/dITP diphosphohydrolase